MKRTTRPLLASLAALAVATVLLAGCSGGQPTGSVSGTVTLNETPLTAGLVLFSDQATGVGVSAELDASGKYHVPSLPTGEYQVAIGPPPAPAPHEMGQPRASQPDIPLKYSDFRTSGLGAAVQRGSNTADFSL